MMVDSPVAVGLVGRRLLASVAHDMMLSVWVERVLVLVLCRGSVVF